jgi:hypothetical protein
MIALGFIIIGGGSLVILIIANAFGMLRAVLPPFAVVMAFLIGVFVQSFNPDTAGRILNAKETWKEFQVRKAYELVYENPPPTT